MTRHCRDPRIHRIGREGIDHGHRGPVPHEGNRLALDPEIIEPSDPRCDEPAIDLVGEMPGPLGPRDWRALQVTAPGELGIGRVVAVELRPSPEATEAVGPAELRVVAVARE